MVELTQIEFLQGTLTFLFVLISGALGIIIMLKYFQIKQKQLILVGATWLFVVSPYWPDAINYVLILTTGNEIDLALYYLIANVFVPLLCITWGLAISDLVFEEKKKIVLGILSLLGILWEISFLVVYFIDYRLIGTKLGPFIVQWADFIIMFYMIGITLFLITGLKFVSNGLKSNNAEIKLKAKFLLLAFIMFCAGTFIEVAFADSQTPLTITFGRILVITASFCFYCGFILPKVVKKMFIKNE